MTNSGNDDIILIEKGGEEQVHTDHSEHLAAGNRRSPLYVLSDEDRRYLIMDAISRAQEEVVSIRYNDFMRMVLHDEFNYTNRV